MTGRAHAGMTGTTKGTRTVKGTVPFRMRLVRTLSTNTRGEQIA